MPLSALPKGNRQDELDAGIFALCFWVEYCSRYCSHNQLITTRNLLKIPFTEFDG